MEATREMAAAQRRPRASLRRSRKQQWGQYGDGNAHAYLHGNCRPNGLAGLAINPTPRRPRLGRLTATIIAGSRHTTEAGTATREANDISSGGACWVSLSEPHGLKRRDHLTPEAEIYRVAEW